MTQIYRELVALIEQGKTGALATLVSTSGSSPQHTGAKVIFLPDGRIIGTIGGGCMEVEARRIALECLRTKECTLFELKLDDDFGWDDGLICGGRVNIFIEPQPERYLDAYRGIISAMENRIPATLFTTVKSDNGGLGETSLLAPDFGVVRPRHEGLRAREDSANEERRAGTLVLESGDHLYVEPILPRPTLLIAGAGHVGGSLARIGSMCGFEIVIVDDRPSFANKERLPFADRVEVADIAGFIRDFRIDPETYIVIVTRGHRNDAQCLRECIHSNARYIGMIGSKRKIVVIYEELLREGLATAEELSRVHSPLGLAIGAKEVGEIAVSIAAELVAVRREVSTESIGAMQYSPPMLKEALSEQASP